MRIYFLILIFSLLSFFSFSQASVEVIRDINPGSDSSLAEFLGSPDPNYTEHNGFVYFSARDSDFNRFIFRTDGTTSGTKVLNGSQGYYQIKKLGSELLISGGNTLKKSNGELNNFTEVKNNIQAYLYASFWVVESNTLYFSGYNSDLGSELWKTDGTSNGTVLVKDISFGTSSSNPKSFVAFNSIVYFVANNNELWRSDGTESGTYILSDGNTFSSIDNLKISNGHIYFQGTTTLNGTELWRSNGVANGIEIVKDINVGAASSFFYGFEEFEDKLYFLVLSPNGKGLWQTDGTESGTYEIKRFDSIVGLTTLNNRLFFFADDGINGVEPWSSDGTVSGTNLVKDLNPGIDLPNQVPFGFLISGQFYFKIKNNVTGNQQLWKTDGTETGTILIFNSPSIIYHSFFSLNGGLIFAATTPDFGAELHKLIELPQPSSPPSLLNFNTVALDSISASFSATQGNASGYLVIRRLGASPTGVPVAGVTYSVGNSIGNGTVIAVGSTLAFTNTNLLAGTTYHYDVYAYNGSGSAIRYSALPLEGSQQTTQLVAPSNLAFGTSSFTTTTASFTAASSSPDGYIVLRKASSSPTSTPINGTAYTSSSVLGDAVIVTVGSDLTFSDANLMNGITYYYDVYSYHGSGSSIQYSALPLEGSQTTLSLVAPSSLVFGTSTFTTNTASFTAASNSPDGYLVLRKAGSSPTSTLVNGTTYTASLTLGDAFIVSFGSELSFSDVNLIIGVEYYYDIYSYYGSGASIQYSLSALEGSSQTLALLAPNNWQDGTITSTSISASFSSSPGEPSGYLVLRTEGAPSTGVPLQNTSYTLGQNLGDGIVVSVGPQVSFVDQGLKVGTDYYYTVYAYHQVDASIYYSTNNLTANISTLADTTPPVFGANQSTTISTAGVNVTFSTDILDEESGVISALVKYRKVPGQSAYENLPLVKEGNSWLVSISNTLAQQSIEYFFEATNGASLVSTSETHEIAIGSIGVFASPTPGFASTAYRILSFPYQFSTPTMDAIFKDDLGERSNTTWEVYHYSNKNIAKAQSAAIGKGYWFISSKPITQVDLPEGTTLPVSQENPYTLSLNAGWNQIGNPYVFDVAWSDVQAVNSSNLTLRTYEGSFANGSVLKKFSGGFVFTTAPTTLVIPPIQNGQGARIKEQALLEQAIDQDEWEVRFSLTNGLEEYTLGGLGMRRDAIEQYDAFDDVCPPAFEEGLELSFDKSMLGSALTKDIVGSSEANVWNFTVQSSEEESTMRWDNSYFGGGQKALFLQDQTTQQWVDMAAVASYTWQGRGSRQFTVRYADRTELEESLTDDLFLQSIYPNPIAEDFTLSMVTPKQYDGSVSEVSLIDAMGRTLTTFPLELIKGLHQYPASLQTNELSKGTYLLQIKVANQVVTQRVITLN